jgi:hypothetical protein
MSAKETFSQTFERALTARDMKKNIPISFQVPAGTTQLSFHFSYAPINVDGILNLLTLTIFDPSGWRGEGHRHNAPYVLSIGVEEATPGFLPGKIVPGEWSVVVNTHMIMPGSACTFQLTIRGFAASGATLAHRQAQPGTPAGQTPSRGPGWYRGDLHSHTCHSDAVWDVAGLVKNARERGLDFVTLSDHNTISGLDEMAASAASDLLTIGGIELTTFWGHALVLGLRDWVDWRGADGQASLPETRSMDEICREVTRRNGLFIIAHPMAQGDPECTGCHWLYAEVMPGPARVVEVWNDDWDSISNNEQGLKLVYTWLNQGYHLAITAGSDNHGHPGGRHYGVNVVYAQELSAAHILKAVRAGHGYISSGPGLELSAFADQQRAMMGDVLNLTPPDQAELTLRWTDCPPDAQLEWIVDGETRERLSPGEKGVQHWRLPGGSAHWTLFTLRDQEGQMLALTNPIYFDGRA